MLKAFFEPASVAVIGASTDPAKLGHAVLKNLVEDGYARRGKVFPINPEANEILGYPAYFSVLDVPDPIALAVIVIPYPHVPGALRSCGQKEIPAAIVISAGFREAGMGGLEHERELIAIAHEFNIRLIGPNCAGIMDTAAALFASIEVRALPGKTAFITQSGAVGGAVLALAEIYDAMTSSRLKQRLTSDRALGTLSDCRGETVDTDCVEALLDKLRPRPTTIPLGP